MNVRCACSEKQHKKEIQKIKKKTTTFKTLFFSQKNK